MTRLNPTNGLPPAQGLYDPAHEHDACGIGFVASVSGQKSHDIIKKGIQVLLNLAHRGACGCDPETGDGAGVLIQIPHKFFARECEKLGFTLPKTGTYGVGMTFLPVEKHQRLTSEGILERIIKEEGLSLLGWRDTPVYASAIGRVARASQPYIQQIFVRCAPGMDEDAFERKLYVVRKRAESEIRESGIEDAEMFYIPSLSCRTIVYKGLLLAQQITNFYRELADPDVVSALCLVHQRFSTNTFPSWQRAHPYRYVAHNGEINTLRGNVNWMHARQSLLSSPLFGNDIKKLYPIIAPDGSDSANFDNAVELLLQAGRSLPHVMAMLIPEAWSGNPHMKPEKRAFYEYHACVMEPWDGPAAIAFTDGRVIGATLDRNGLRPGRYVVTHDGLVVMASEAGVLDVAPEQVKKKGRLQPGKMFLVDTIEGRIVSDKEIKQKLASRHPYAEWLKENQITIDQLPEPSRMHYPDAETLLRRQRAFGYSDEDLRMILSPMATKGEEPVGSMGTDTPLACLSDKPQSLFNYFKQLFAQVTNPPIDPIREEMVMSLISYIGSERNILEEAPENCHMLKLAHPLLTNRELEKLRRVSNRDLLATTLPALFRAKEGEAGLKRALDELCQRASLAVKAGYSLMILSDRGVDKDYAPIPCLLALAAVHNLLVREETRTQVALITESGEPREVMHFALLSGYGASAINPYLALESVENLAWRGELGEGITRDLAVKHFLKAIKKGLLKTFSKMGISTLQSYQGAQVFEAIGLNKDLVDAYFAGTTSRIEGVGLSVLANEALLKHDYAFRPLTDFETELTVGGNYHQRVNGEYHLLNPLTISKLQHAVRQDSFKTFQEYTDLIDKQSAQLCTLRGLMKLKKSAAPVPLEDVEPAKEIVKRFTTGAMSFGSISKEAHETLAIAMNRIGGKSNTGEGGEDEERFKPDPNGDLRRSAVKQVASARFGVTANYLVNADELQIKMAQGAKPGEGGQLPGTKVYPWIAKTRLTTAGVGLISPPPHHDIYSIEDLAELIHDLKNANRQARISVKLVAEVGVGTIAAGVAKARAGCVVIAGYEGGTGAAPLSSLAHAGLPWELGLAETQQVLVANRLRDRIRVQVDGGLRTSRDVIIAALLGAEEFGMATASLIATGCVMLRKCHLNTCSVGIATQDPALRARYTGKPEDVIAYFTFVAERVRERIAALGARSLDELIGRVELLRPRAVDHPKARRLDLSAILAAPAAGPRRFARPVPWDLTDHVDHDLIRRAESAIAGGRPVELAMPIDNARRAVGTLLSGEIARRHGARGLPDGAIKVRFSGSAGQSFGAFLAPGVTLELCGDANDYIAKGMSGGRIVVYPPASARYAPEHNVIVGNVALYVATAGDLFACGLAGERFAVRNSGARAVVEGVGDHGCEYMTGGVVVVLGAVGRNFAAGMSGGTAYVFDQAQSLRGRCNLEMVELESVVEESDLWLLNGLIEDHVRFTSSPLGRRVLDNWQHLVSRFVKVMPTDYKRVLQARRAAQRPRPGQLAVVGGR